MTNIFSICVLLKLCWIYSCYGGDPYYNMPAIIRLSWNTKSEDYSKLKHTYDEYDQAFRYFKYIIEHTFQTKVYLSKITSDNLLSVLDDTGPRSNYTVSIILDTKNFYKLDYNEILKRNYIYAGDGLLETENIKVKNCSGKYYEYICNANSENKKESTIPKDPKNTITTFDSNKNKDGINKEKIKPVNKKMIMEQKCKEHEDIVSQNATCEVVQKRFTVKLVSKNVLLYPALYNFLNDYDGFKEINLSKYIPEKRYCPDKTIYVCQDIRYRESSKTERQCKYECDDFVSSGDVSTIAILAPTLSHVRVPMTQVTTIFSNKSQTSFEENSVKDNFPNSFYWMPIEKTMYAIVEFLRSIKRTRVAIISDDLPSSQEYEKKITKLLDAGNFIYVSRSCDVSNCDFAKLLAPLVAVEARIIIANVDYEQSKDFVKQVKQYPQLVWICKSPAMAEIMKSENLPNVFATTMMPASSRGVTEDKYYYNDLTPYTSILKNVISKIHIEKPYNHRYIASQIKYQLHKKQTISISIQKYADRIENMAIMDILPSNRIRNYKLYSNSEPIDDELRDCTIRSSYYLKPCYDMEFIYIMLIIAGLLVAVLAIAYYFHTMDTPYTRMSN